MREAIAGWFYAAAGYTSDGGTLTAWVVTLPFRGLRFCLYWIGEKIDPPAELELCEADFGEQVTIPHEGIICSGHISAKD